MGVGHMSRPLARRCLAPGTTVAPGEVMVATEIGDPARRLLGSISPWCEGAVRALEQARETVMFTDGPVHVYGWLAASEQARDDLVASGAIFVSSLDDVPDGSTLVIPAHGVPPAVLDEAARRGLRTVDATCPLVTAVH